MFTVWEGRAYEELCTNLFAPSLISHGHFFAIKDGDAIYLEPESILIDGRGLISMSEDEQFDAMLLAGMAQFQDASARKNLLICQGYLQHSSKNLCLERKILVFYCFLGRFVKRACRSLVPLLYVAK